MFKKIVTGALMAGLLAISSASATAQNSPENVDRGMAALADGGGQSLAISTPLLLAIFSLFAVGLILVIDENDNDTDLPVSP